MAERPETKTRSRAAPPRPWWRRRRFWQAVIAVELGVALLVSYVATEDEGAAPITVRSGLPDAHVSGS